LCRLTERELADIGITRGEIDHITSDRSMAYEVSAHLIRFDWEIAEAKKYWR
jgi:hypothetical protein